MRPTTGKAGQNRKIEMRRRHNLLADKAGADQARKTDAEDGQRQSGRDLVDRKSERQNAENPRQRGTGQDAAKRADKDRTGQIGTGEAAGCANDHHALNAEVENAGAFDHKLAGRRQQERRRGGDDRENKADRENQLYDVGERFKHGQARPFARWARSACGRRSASCRRARRTAGCPGRPWSGRAALSSRSVLLRRR